MEKIKGALALGLLHFVALLPWRLVQLLGSFIGWIMWVTPNSSKRVAHINLSHCFPELDDKAVDKLTRQALKGIGKTTAESACAWIWPVEKTLKRVHQVEGLEVLQQAVAEGKAIVGITSHLGNWEVLNHFFCQQCSPIIFYRPPKLKALDDLLAKQRTKMGNRVAPSTREGILRVIKEVRNGGAVGIPADPEPSLNSGIFVPFLGTQALTSKFVSGMVAGKQDRVAAVFLHAIRLENGQGFKVIIEAAPYDLYSENTTESVTALSRTIAGYVGRGPDQYMWTMKRFRRRPGSEPRWY